MFTMRSKRLPLRSWITPLIVVAIFVIALGVDYINQTESVTVLGQDVVYTNIEQVVIQPMQLKTSSQAPVTVKNSDSIHHLVQLLHSATPSDGTTENTQNLGAILIESSSSDLLDIPVVEALPSRSIYLSLNGRTYQAPNSLLPFFANLLQMNSH